MTDALGGRLQRREIIAVFLQEIRDAVCRHVQAGLRDGDRARQPLLAQRQIFVEQPHDGPAHQGITRRYVMDIEIGERQIGENLVAEDLHQIAGQARMVAFRQFARIDAEILRQLEQQRHRDAPPVVLDQIQIAGRDSQKLRQLRLRHGLGAAQALDASPDPRRSFHGGLILYRIDKKHVFLDGDFQYNTLILLHISPFPGSPVNVQSFNKRNRAWTPI